MVESPLAQTKQETMWAGDLKIDAGDFAIPAALIVDAGELMQIGRSELREELKELLILLQQGNKAVDVYLHQGDLFSLENHPNPWVRALRSESRVHVLRHPAEQLRHKDIVVYLSFDQEASHDAALDQIRSEMRSSKQIIPLYGKAGSATAFLVGLGAALQKASEIKQYFEDSVLSKIAKRINGRWEVYDNLIAEVRSQLRAAYAVAVAA